ncbi:MAG: SDR family oxidoreductase [Alcaligenaceae bacterium]|nr:MAG: SDR family oxidoreductase [Alcaligenaceae bacterium]
MFTGTIPTVRKTILITGATSGLGEGMARAFAREGHDLALLARRVDRLEELRRELQAHDDIRVAVRRLDVEDAECVAPAFEEVEDELGGIDRIICNAGVAAGGQLGQGHTAGNLAIARTNFVGSLAQIESALTIFRRRNAGHLVLISSTAAVRPLPGNLATYSASKIALASLGRSLAMDYSASPIKISTIFPGWIRTPLNAHMSKQLFEIDQDTGVRALVSAIKSEKSRAFVRTWPWLPFSFLMQALPEAAFRRLAKD